MEEGWHFPGGVIVGFRMTAALGLAAFLLLGLPLLVSAADGDVVINEVMWMGSELSASDEWLELLNLSDKEIDVGGWVVRGAGTSGQPDLTLPDDLSVPGGGYLVIANFAADDERSVFGVADVVASSVSLVNSGEDLILINVAGQVEDEVMAGEGWPAGTNGTQRRAMERAESGNWYEATATSDGVHFGTPGRLNSEPKVNAAPQAEILGPVSGLAGEELVFSAQESSDVDGDELGFSWSFGDGGEADGIKVTHVFAAEGTYLVRVAVTDGQIETEAEVEVEIEKIVYSDQIIINEFLPDPEGADVAGEFVELKNTAGEAVNLFGWQLDDAEGGSAPFTIEQETIVASGEIVLFERVKTGLALNNGGDTVRLLDPAGEVRTAFSYSSSNAGVSYNFKDGDYVLSATPTPGKENFITEPDEDEQENDDKEENKDQKGEVLGESVVSVALAGVREEEVGTRIETEGVVSVPPGVLGEKILYLAGSGIQVYYYDEEWPELKLGDKVLVQGELSTSLGEYRLKLATGSDVEVVSSGEPPVPHRVQTGKIDEAMEGSLVMFEGEVTDTSGDTFYVDDGSGAIKVYIKKSAQIDKPKMSKGTDVTITGVVSRTNSGYRVLPRWQEDVRLGRVAGLTSFPATGLQLGFGPRAGQGYLRQTGHLILSLIDWIDFGF